jgi:hypothetical protein
MMECAYMYQAIGCRIVMELTRIQDLRNVTGLEELALDRELELLAELDRLI